VLLFGLAAGLSLGGAAITYCLQIFQLQLQLQLFSREGKKSNGGGEGFARSEDFGAA